MNTVERARSLILHPTQEWDTIAEEPATVTQLFTGYVMILAAIPAISSFIGFSLVGASGVRVPVAYGVTHLVVGYVMTLAAVYAIALIIDGLAPHFGGQKNFLQALKVAAFAPTPAWLAGIFLAVPLLAILSLFASLYSFYLLFTGVPKLMKVPESQVVGYLAVILLCAIVLTVLVVLLRSLAIPGIFRGF